MIRDGAGMALSVEEVAEAAWQAWERSHAAECNSCLKIKKQKEANTKERMEKKTEERTVNRIDVKLLQWLAERSMTADEILDCFHESESADQKESMDIATMQSILTELVMEGRIGCQGGCYSKQWKENRITNK